MRGCYNVTDEGVRYHIPGCWGCAIYGHDRCSCERPGKRSLTEEVSKLREEVRELKSRVSAGGPSGSSKEPTSAGA